MLTLSFLNIFLILNIFFIYSCSQYNIFVEDIMVRKVKFISSQSTYREVKHLLDSFSLKTIPLVDSKGMLIMYLI